MNCRHCGAELSLPVIDLGSSPPSNAYLSQSELLAPAVWYPLRVLVCTDCWLVQTEDYAARESLFIPDYAYFSSYSSSWLRHAEAYVETICTEYCLGPSSTIVEVAANDGYLLQYARQRNIPCYGIEPTARTAAAARAKGLEIVEDFFGAELARQLVEAGKQADVMTANNVLAHVPDINDFVSGFAVLLKHDGVATFEFPHVIALIEGNLFDTIYHEHYSYLSFTSALRILTANGLSVFDVQKLATHGGSLRVFAGRADGKARKTTSRVKELLDKEHEAGVCDARYYTRLQESANRTKNRLLSFLLTANQDGKTVGAYGAAAKGNTLLNYAGVRPDLLPWIVDRNPEKQGKYMPGSGIRIVEEEHLLRTRPDYVLVLPWNLSDEISRQLSYVREWGGRLVRAVPELEIL